jgi:hypothetical protein
MVPAVAFEPACIKVELVGCLQCSLITDQGVFPGKVISDFRFHIGPFRFPIFFNYDSTILLITENANMGILKYGNIGMREYPARKICELCKK